MINKLSSGVFVNGDVYEASKKAEIDLNELKRGEVTYVSIDGEKSYRVEIPLTGELAIVDTLNINLDEDTTDGVIGCPFCGDGDLWITHNEKLEGESYKLTSNVLCDGCGTTGPKIVLGRNVNDDRKEEFMNTSIECATQLWNTRADKDGSSSILDDDMIADLLSKIKVMPTDIGEIIKDIKSKMETNKPKDVVEDIKEKINESAEVLKDIATDKIDSLKNKVGSKLQDLADKLKK